MSFYIYSILVPLIIFMVFVFIQRSRDGSNYLFLRGFLRALPYLFFYLFLLYYLEREGFIDSGWAFYALIFFLLPMALIAIIFHLIFKKKYEK
jgi:hypothetical protein